MMFGNDFEVRNLINEQYVVSEALTNSFDWNQDVLGGIRYSRI